MTEKVRTCLYFNQCSKTEVYNGKRWKIGWCNYQDEWICRAHYNTLIINPTITKERRREYHKKDSHRRLVFLLKRFYLVGKPRTGKCEICFKNIGDEYINGKGKIAKIKLTVIHHWFYLPIMVWACTIEKCVSCHQKEHWKNRKVY